MANENNQSFMMKWSLTGSILSLLVFISPLGLMADDYLDDADRHYVQGGIKYYKRCINLYLKSLETNPDDFESIWKCARAHWKYAKETKGQNVKGWKNICAGYGKDGMKYAQKAIEIKPDKPDGYYYYGLNAGIYADGVSILTALREGLKDSVRMSLEKVYELDKMYDNAESLLGLGRYWAVVPWPFRDRRKALSYYREYQKTEYFAGNDEARIYLAELLLKLKEKGHKAEAKGLLEKAAQSDKARFRNRAQKLLAKIT